MGVAALRIGADGDDILVFAVGSEEVACCADGLQFLLRADFEGHTADAFQNIHCWEMVCSSQGTAENHMAIQNTSNCVGDRFVHVVAIDQNGVEGCDRTLFGIARALKQAGQDRENRRRVAAAGGGFSHGQTDFALGHGVAGHGVHHEEDFFAFIAEMLGDGCGDVRGAAADEGRLVGGRDDDDRARHALRAKIFFYELAEFASTLADEGDDIDIRLGSTGDHAEEGGFADSRAGKNTEALTTAHRGEKVEGFHAGLEGLENPLAGEGIGRLTMQRA
jgi:hypothetical protein